jgi:HPt (histidine-containing phosphotransfer) domain-containing protein
MDHMMPGMDGIEATMAIRDWEKSFAANQTKVPIVALTANAIEGSRELYLSSGMDDFMTKPIDKSLLVKILEKWLPAEKTSKEKPAGASADVSAEADASIEGTGGEFWNSIEKIDGLSVKTGLDRVSGQREVYKKLLELVTKEIEKCDKNLNEFLAANDMHNFRIEVHSMKGSLANIGVMELSKKALELETASSKEDAAFCAANLAPFLKELQILNTAVAAAFASETQNRAPITIPPQLPPIFEKLTAAFAAFDFSGIDKAVDALNSLNTEGALKEEIEKIKDAVLTTDYDGAAEIMKGLLKS